MAYKRRIVAIVAVALAGTSGCTGGTPSPASTTTKPAPPPITRTTLPEEPGSTTSPAVVTGPAVGDGTWTVGVDIPAGQYQTAADVAAGCYWWVYKSGVTPEQILYNVVANGSPDSGRPVVALADGQTFQVWNCGKWSPV